MASTAFFPSFDKTVSFTLPLSMRNIESAASPCPNTGSLLPYSRTVFRVPIFLSNVARVDLERCAVDIHPLPASRLTLRRAPGRRAAPHGLTLDLGRIGRWSIMLSASARALEVFEVQVQTYLLAQSA